MISRNGKELKYSNYKLNKSKNTRPPRTYRQRIKGRRTKTIIVTITVALIIILIVLYVVHQLSEYATASKCQISVMDIEVEHIGLTEANLLIVFSVYNPTSTIAKIPSIKYSVIIENIYVGHGTTSSLRVPPHSVGYLCSSFKIIYSSIPKIIVRILEAKFLYHRTLRVTVEGTAKVCIGFTCFTVPFVKSKDVDP